MQENSLGQRLRARREELGLTIKDIADGLQTSQNFVRALEEGLYKEFTAKVYARGFFLRLLTLLGITDDAASLVFQFEQEWEISMRSVFYKPTPGVQEVAHVTPLQIRRGVMVCVLLLLLSFLGFRLFNFLRAPALVIHEPFDQEARKSEPVMKVTGKGEKESRLTVNGRELRMAESGEFADTIEMLPGLNTLEFILENRFGKLTRVTRYVLVE